MADLPLLREVARIYCEAAEGGHHPTKAVVLHYRWTRSKASRVVREARDAGLIPPAGERDQVWRNRKAVLVADAIGANYDDLCDAVWRHAEGDLRL